MASPSASLSSRIQENITYPSPGADGQEAAIQAFLAVPSDSVPEAGRGSVIVIHEIFGLTDHIRSIASRLAQAGYMALAVDFFTREGPAPDMAQGFPLLRQFVGSISDAQLMADIRAGANYLQQQPESNGKVGVVGFCWGGRISMLSCAYAPEIAASVAYYGRISGDRTDRQPTFPIDVVEQMQSPLLGHFGATDAGIPPAEAERLRAALEAYHKTGEIHVYEGAGHAFNNDTRESYNAEAAQQSWEHTLDWYAKYLK